MHTARSGMEGVPYCFSKSPVNFEGHTGCKTDDVAPIWGFPDGNFNLNSTMDMLHLVMLCIIALLVYHWQSSYPRYEQNWPTGPYLPEKLFMAVQRKHDVQIHPLVKQVFFDNQYCFCIRCCAKVRNQISPRLLKLTQLLEPNYNSTRPEHRGHFFRW